MKIRLYTNVPFCNENLVKEMEIPNFMDKVYSWNYEKKEKDRYLWVYNHDYLIY